MLFLVSRKNVKSDVAKKDMNGAFVEYPKNKYKVGENWIRYLIEKETNK